MISRQVGALLEGNAVDLFGGIEHSVDQHAFKLEIRLDLAFVERVALLSHHLGVIRPVPGLEFERLLLDRVDHRLQVCAFLACIGHGHRRESAEHALNRIDGLGGALLEHVIGVSGVAEHVGLLCTQPEHRRDDLTVVELVAAAAAHQRAPGELFTHVTTGQLGQLRLTGEIHQRQCVLAFQATAGSFAGSRFDLSLAQSFQLGGGVDDQCDVVDFLEHVLRKLGTKPGQFAVDLSQTRLLLVVQPCAGANEIPMGFFEQTQLFGIKAQAIALLVERINPGEQIRVQQDRIAVRRQPRRHLALDLLAGIIGVGTDQVEEHRGHPRQHPAAALHGHDGVVEAGCHGTGRDSLDLGQMLFHAALHGRDEVLVANLVEWRHLQRQRGDFEEWVHGRFLSHVRGHFTGLLDGLACRFGHLRVSVLAAAGGQAQQCRDDQTQSDLGHLNFFPVRFLVNVWQRRPRPTTR